MKNDGLRSIRLKFGTQFIIENSIELIKLSIYLFLKIFFKKPRIKILFFQNLTQQLKKRRFTKYTKNYYKFKVKAIKKYLSVMHIITLYPHIMIF